MADEIKIKTTTGKIRICNKHQLDELQRAGKVLYILSWKERRTSRDFDKFVDRRQAQ